MRRVVLGLMALTACTNPTAAEPQGSKAKAESKPSAGTAGGTSMMDASSGRLPKDQVVAEMKGKKFTYGDLLEAAASDLREAQTEYLQKVHQIEQQALEQVVIQHLVEKKAKEKGIDPGDFVKSLGDGVPEPTDKQIQDFYDQRVASSGQPLDAVRARIVTFLKGQAQQEKIREAMTAMKKEAGVKTSLPPPDLPKAEFDLAGRPSKGPDDAKVTVVEFSDFQCPYCSRAAPQLAQLMKDHPEEVKVYFLHYPLSFHPQAMPSAIAAECAHAQGKFWELHDQMFANQRELAPDKYTEWAKSAGLDMKKFEACQKDPKTEARIQSDMAMGRAAGVSGTPSFFVNGVPNAAGIPNSDTIQPYL